MIKNRIIKMLLAVTMLIIHAAITVNSVNAANIGETKTLERGDKGYYCVQKWDGSKWIYLTYNQTFYTDTDGQRYIAYCLSPGAPGVGYVSGEKDSYNVKIDNMLDDDRIWRVLKNGYPNKSVSELGVETEDDAYFATMQSINAILRGYSLEQSRELYSPGKFAINGESYEDIQRRGGKTLDLMFKLIDVGLNGTETRKQFLDISIKKSSDFIKENNNLYSQSFNVISSSEISEYYIENVEGLPEGSYIADEKGVAKQIFNGNEKFKVIVPEEIIKDDINGSIHVKAKQKNYPVYFGASSIEGFQNYALCNKSYSEVSATANIPIKVNKSNLTIIKIDSENKEPIEGVKFKVTLSNGEINTYITDKDGKISITNQKPGDIKVQEIETLDKYKLDSKEMNVKLNYNESKEIKIENKLKKGSIKIKKVDEENNEIKLANVKFELKDENNNVVKEGTTNEEGVLLFDNLVLGKYKIVEVETNKEYTLNDREIVAEVTDERIKDIVINNKKKQKDEQTEETQEITVSVQKELPKTGSNMSKNVYQILGQIVAILMCVLYNKHVKK